MIKIAVYNNKGGVGKTTLAIHLAFYAEMLGIRTIGTCIDSQADFWRWGTQGDGIQRADNHFTRGSLDIVYGRDEVPDFHPNAAELLIIDCSPNIDLSLQLKPDIFLVPFHGRMAYENFTSISEDLQAVAKVLAVINCAGRGGRGALKELKKGLAALRPPVHVAKTELIESDTITRASEYYMPIWDIPYAKRSKAPDIMKALCREILQFAGVSTTPRKKAS